MAERKFVCPKCKGTHFGSFEEDHGLAYECHGEFGPCSWQGAKDKCFVEVEKVMEKEFTADDLTALGLRADSRNSNAAVSLIEAAQEVDLDPDVYGTWTALARGIIRCKAEVEKMETEDKFPFDLTGVKETVGIFMVTNGHGYSQNQGLTFIEDVEPGEEARVMKKRLLECPKRRLVCLPMFERGE